MPHRYFTRELANGRLNAQRLAPEIPADLKIILQR